ncbi:MAG: D-alanine--D-alanine ligase [Planctomycetota bacterium]|nr:D-alanine--D-alanine ligase [Planctomycetota bacterium]
MTRVLVLGGGPDAEREVSLESSRCVAEALASLPGLTVHREVIARLTLPELRALPGEVIFPALHGPFGEGGPLQDLLELDARPFVGCRPHAARLAMDKVATKLAAARAGVPTAEALILNTADPACPMPPPVVVKPVHEGSSVGVHICRTHDDWSRARAAAVSDRAAHPARTYMVERAILGGREVTVGVLDGAAFAPVEIRPATEFYDYQAKYTRDDTTYVVDPDLPAGVSARLREHAVTLARAIGVRHLCRVDFLLDAASNPWLLEVNTMPGFTTHSLLPMGAQHAGLSFAALCHRLVQFAQRDHPAA